MLAQDVMRMTSDGNGLAQYAAPSMRPTAAFSRQRIHRCRMGDRKANMDGDAIFSMMAGMQNRRTAAGAVLTCLLLAGVLFVWAKLS
jgi:hypothetical protein